MPFFKVAAWWRSWRRKLSPIHRTGVRCERLAAEHLKQQRYRILATNLRLSFGEIDILAEAPDGRTVVLIEVKGRALGGGEAAGELQPEVHVNAAKQRKLVSLAVAVARRYGLEQRPWRFDVIGVDLQADGRAVVRHHPGAFAARW